MSSAPSHLASPAPRPGLVPALGVIEIFAWGSSFYLMAVLAPAIGAETGWSAGTLSAGVTAGLLVSAVAATSVGRAIQRHGGRPVLASGLALLAAGLVLLGLGHGLPLYFAAWVLLGLGMSASLYDAAFSTLGRLYGPGARARITQLTLWGGFASTVCWPLTAALVAAIGWRGTCLAYGALHLALTIPLALWALPRPRPAAPAAPPSAVPPPVAATDPRFLALVAAGIAMATLATIWSVHLVALLGAIGTAKAAAIALGTLIGPAQVGARLVEMMGRGRHHPVWTALVATSAIPVGLAGLLAGAPAAAAMIAYGAGNGLWSIARGALPLALFGADGYAALMGRLARPMLLASALAPLLGGWLIEAFGARTTLEAMSLLALVPPAAALYLMRGVRRSARAAAPPG